ncbi:MAG: hypothetical protein KDA61_15375, partial [Planctomycetales bacterium]|nr:hypothetical protein [Planctomycetales bacterium]
MRRLGYLLVASVWCVWNGLSVHAQDAPAVGRTVARRVALCDVGGPAQARGEILDLLTARLSHSPDWTLVERRQTAQIMRERQLNLQLSDDRRPIQSAGRELRADLLVLFQASVAKDPTPPPSAPFESIDVRLVETEGGALLGKLTLAWFPSDVDASLAQLSQLGDALERRLTQWCAGARRPLTVSLAGIRRREASFELYRLQRRLEDSLESQLAAGGAVAVVERRRTLPLTEERNLAGDANPLAGADAVVSGELRLNFHDAHPAVELALQIHRRNGSTHEQIVSVLLDNAESLVARVADAVLTLLELDAQPVAFDSQTEAKMLVEEAQRLLSLWRWHEAFERLTAAYALDPQAPRTRALLLQTGSLSGPDLSGPRNEAAPYATALLLTDVARQSLDAIADDPLAGSHDDDLRSEWTRIDYVHRMLAAARREVPQPTPEQQDADQWLQQSTASLYERYLEVGAALDGEFYDVAIYSGLQNGASWAADATAALTQRFDLFQRAAARTPTSPFGFWCLTVDHRFALSAACLKASDETIDAAYAAYFARFEGRDNPWLQAIG